jgi:hypothetical protein
LLEQFPAIAELYYGNMQFKRGPSILKIKNIFLESPPEEALRKAEPLIVELVDSTILNNGLLDYRNISTTLVDCLSSAVTIVHPKSNLKDEHGLQIFDEYERKRSSLLVNIDSIFRDAFMRLLKTTFGNRDWKKAIEILEGFEFCLADIQTFMDEAIFANWIGDLRAFYKENLEVELDRLTRKSYDEDLYNFTITFSTLLTMPLQKALELRDGIFTLGFGLDVVGQVIKDQINKTLMFHTSEDDFANPIPLSVMIEPIMIGISNCVKLLSAYSVEPIYYREIEARWDELTDLLFLVLNRYRELNSETDIDRAMLGSILSTPEIICSQNFPSKLEGLLNYHEPRRFDYILRPIRNALRNNKESFDDRTLYALYNTSLASFRVQRPLYGRIREELRELCIDCIEYISDEYKPRMLLTLSDELISPPEKNDDDSAVYGFQLIGRLVHEFGEKPEFLTLFKEKMAVLEKVEAPTFLADSERTKTLLEFVHKKNKEIANWKPRKQEEFEGLKVWHPSYKDWEVEGSKKVIELFTAMNYK